MFRRATLPPGMSSPSATVREPSPVLFVAREPDETLRTFLPVVDALRDRHGVASRVLFHHVPESWARDELTGRGLVPDEVAVPSNWLATTPPFQRLGLRAPGRTIDEVGRFWQARTLARSILDARRPAAVVVIQDTLLLERFLVREANHRGVPTLVVQWAFSFPQALYDRIRELQYGPRAGQRRRGPLGRVAGPLTARAYRGVLDALGLSFDLVNSYGGGEARLFAVMGEEFREQYLAQGVVEARKRIVVTGHPTHDAVYRRRQTLTDTERRTIRAQYGLAGDEPLVLYATQPVLWRRVVSREELQANVRAIAAAVRQAPGSPRLVLKLHPREQAEDYAFCAELDPPVTVLPRAEIVDLIAACDAFISSSSSTVLLAMMFGRPIVTVNFNQVPHFDHFEGIGGTLHVRSHEDFARAMGQVLADAATRERLAIERSAVLDRYTRFDGGATERIAGLLVAAMGRAATTGVGTGVGTEVAAGVAAP